MSVKVPLLPHWLSPALPWQDVHAGFMSRRDSRDP
jgi:hypothetical protein